MESMIYLCATEVAQSHCQNPPVKDTTIYLMDPRREEGKKWTTGYLSKSFIVALMLFVMNFTISYAKKPSAVYLNVSPF